MRNAAPSRSRREQAIGLLARIIDRLLSAAGGMPAPEPHAVRRILLVKPCCLGDLLMATPAIRALHQHFPEAEIDILTTNWSAPAVLGNPHIAHRLSYPASLRPDRLWHLVRTLRRQRYGLGVSLDRSPVVNGLLRLAAIPIRAGIDNQHRGIGLTHRAAPRPSEHETELFLRVLQSLGIPISAGESRPEYHVSESARAAVTSDVPSSEARLVVIHPGGAVNPGVTMLSKRWPPARFADLIGQLSSELPASFVLVGAASDRPVVDAIKRAIVSDADVIDLCEQLSLPELAAVIERAALYVGNDSGTSHLAAAVGTPTVTIFGPTSPRRYRPLGPQSVVCAPEASWALTADADLRTTHAGEAVPSIESVSVEEVAAACRRILLGERSGDEVQT